MAKVLCNIDGVSSSAYMKSGSAVGTVPVLPRRYDGTYQITVTKDFTAWQKFYIFAYTSYGDSSLYSITIDSGNAVVDGELIDAEGSFTATITIGSDTEYMYVQAQTPYSPSISSFTFNGSSGTYGYGDGSYKWNINSSYPSVSVPDAPAIVQNDDGTLTASWNAVNGSNGSGSVQYRLWSTTDGEALSSYTTKTSVTLDIHRYDTQISYRIEAYFCSATAYSTNSTVTFISPAISIPYNLRTDVSEGEEVTLSWSSSSLSNTSGTITYTILKNGSQIATTSNTTYSFDKKITSSWGSSPVTQTVKATASTVNKHYSTLTSGTSSGVSFTYKRTVGVLRCYDVSTSGWKEYEVYCYNNGFQPYEVYVYSNGWKQCE